MLFILRPSNYAFISVTKSFIPYRGLLCSASVYSNHPSEKCWSKLLSPSVQPVRYHVTGFLNKYPASELWKSVSSVSKAGKKRGRGKNRGNKVIRDLNKGQIMGIGKENIRWPGLSAPILRGRELIQQQKLPPDEKYQESILKAREKIWKPRSQRISPLDRGWTGGHPEGRKLGPPDPVADYDFNGFETVILDQKPILRMTRHFGRYRTTSAICATGNGNGLIGYSLVQAPDTRAALRKARNRAAQKLVYIPRYDDRTIIHNFYSRFCNTHVYAFKQSPGYGIKAHRLVKSMCELIGIKDIYCKVEGGHSPLSIIRAFLLGLLRQKTFEELANETNLHVVEMSKETDFFPKVLSSPQNPIDYMEETPDFELYLFDNQLFRMPERRRNPVHEQRRTWPIEVRKKENLRSHFKAQLEILAQYGEMRSFLTDKFPECKYPPPPWTRKPKQHFSKRNEITEE